MNAGGGKTIVRAILVSALWTGQPHAIGIRPDARKHRAAGGLHEPVFFDGIIIDVEHVRLARINVCLVIPHVCPQLFSEFSVTHLTSYTSSSSPSKVCTGGSCAA